MRQRQNVLLARLQWLTSRGGFRSSSERSSGESDNSRQSSANSRQSSDNSENHYSANNERPLHVGEKVWFPGTNRKPAGTGVIKGFNNRKPPQLLIERETVDGLGKLIVGEPITRNVEKCRRLIIK